jgi:hypothetical protein
MVAHQLINQKLKKVQERKQKKMQVLRLLPLTKTQAQAQSLSLSGVDLFRLSLERSINLLLFLMYVVQVQLLRRAASQEASYQTQIQKLKENA